MTLNNFLSIKHKIKLPLIKTKKPPMFLIIHGYGSNEEDLFFITKKLPDNFFVISLRGINNLNNGGYSWYNIDFSKKLHSISGAINARNKIIFFIKEAIEYYNLDYENIWICGFSQGAILSYSIALNKINIIKKAIILSGFLYKKIITENDLNLFKNKSLEFFITHGENDNIIPLKLSKKGCYLLEKYKIPFFYKEYKNIGHTLCEENFNNLIKWINNKS